MKKILITGKDSYIGTSVEKWLLKEPNKYHIETLDMKDPNWKQFDFSIFDVVFHVAGIAHVKETKKNRDLYYKINRDLAFETAQKAKESNVKQFIFLSSMSVYGMETGVITKETQPKPKSAYGKSKLEAEKLIQELESKDFKVAILRPPMVYGPNCPGNYAKLEKLALKLPFYPNIKNTRSVLSIDGLSVFIDLIIEKNKFGLILPQDKNYKSTTEMIDEIRSKQQKKIKKSKVLNAIILLFPFFKIFKKMYGNLIYERYDEDF